MAGKTHREPVNGPRIVQHGKIALSGIVNTYVYAKTLADNMAQDTGLEYHVTGTEGDYSIIEYEKQRTQSDYLD